MGAHPMTDEAIVREALWALHELTDHGHEDTMAAFDRIVAARDEARTQRDEANEARRAAADWWWEQYRNVAATRAAWRAKALRAEGGGDE